MAENPFTIAQIRTFPVGTPIPLIHGVLTDVFEHRKNIGRNKSTIQSAMLQDAAGDKIRLNIWNHQDYAARKGAAVTIIALTEKGKCSTRSIENTYHTPPALELEVSKTSQVLFSGDQNMAPPPDHSSAPDEAPGRGGSAPKSQPVRRQINGQNVGMCVKEAIGLVKEAAGELPWAYLKSPDFYKDVWQVSSSLIRVSSMLESGDLAPSFVKKPDVPTAPPPTLPTPAPTPPPVAPPAHQSPPERKTMPGPEGAAFDPNDPGIDNDVPF